MPQFPAPYGFGTQVNIDGDTSIKAVVIGYHYQPSGTKVQVSWFANGDLKEVWIDQLRISRALP